MCRAQGALLHFLLADLHRATRVRRYLEYRLFHHAVTGLRQGTPVVRDGIVEADKLQHFLALLGQYRIQFILDRDEPRVVRPLLENHFVDTQVHFVAAVPDFLALSGTGADISASLF